jgi:DNA-binding MarR family transcriptional regulator
MSRKRVALAKEPDIETVAIQLARQHHIGRLLLRASRSFSERAILRFQARGYPGLGTAHVALLPYIELTGTRITTLAERAGLTKQAVGQLVQELERLGYVTRQADPRDGRAILVTFTETGRQLLRDGLAIIQEIEEEDTKILGEEGVRDLHTLLNRLLSHLDDGPSEQQKEER